MIPAYVLDWQIDPLSVDGPGCRTPEVARVAIDVDLGKAFQVTGLIMTRLEEADVPPSTPIALRAFHEWLLPKVDPIRSGSVTPMADDDPALPPVLAAFDAELAGAKLRAPSTPGAPLSAFDTSDLAWGWLVARAARAYALPRELVVQRLLPLSPHAQDESLAIIDSAFEGGYCQPRSAADSIIEEIDHGRALRNRDAKRLADAAARALMKIPRTGLCQLNRTAPILVDAPQRLESRMGFAGRIPPGLSYYFLGGLPGFTGTLAPGLTIETGVFELTDREYAECIPIGDLAVVIAENRAALSDPRGYSEADFTGDIRTIEGSWARECALPIARQLLRAALISDTAHACAYAEKCLLTLGVAFGGRLSVLNVADLIGDVLTERANEGRTRTIEYVRDGGHNRQVEGALSDANWSGLMRPAAVPAKMLAALSEGSPWAWGELWIDPSPADRRRIARDLDPNILVRAIAKLTGSRNEVRTEALYEELHNAEVTDTITPSSGIRKTISSALRTLGFAKVEVSDKAGRRRAWLRTAPEIVDAAPLALPPEGLGELTVGDLVDEPAEAPATEHRAG